MVSRALASDSHSMNVTLQQGSDVQQELDALWKESLEEYAKASQMSVAQLTAQFSKLNVSKLDSAKDLIDEVVKPWDDFKIPTGTGKPALQSSLRRRLGSVLQAIIGQFDMIDRLADLSKNLAFPPAQVVAGAVYIFMQASKSQGAENEQAINTLEQIQFFLSRMEIGVENQLVSRQLRRIFILIIRDILLICARLAKINKKGQVKGYFRNLFVGQDKHLNALCSHLGVLVDEEIRLVTINSAAAISMTSRRVDSMSAKINNLRISKSKELQLQSKVSEPEASKSIIELRKALETVNVEEDLIRFKKIYIRGTGDWFVNHEVFQSWLSESGLLWVHGAPGVGKSTLAAHAIGKLMEQASNVLYFFCRYDQPKKRDPKVILQTVALRLAEQDIDYKKEVLKLAERGVNLTDIDVLTLWYHLFDIPLRKYKGKPISWVIDGLDELESSDQIDLAELLATLMEVATNIKILLISRQHVACAFVLSRLKASTMAIRSADTSSGIAKYTEVVAASLPLGDMQEKFAAALQSRSNGVFLWVRLVIDQVKQEDSMEGIWRAFEAFPDDLGSMYERIFTKISKEMSLRRKELVRKLFNWVIQCQTQLHYDELATILNFEGEKILDIQQTISTLSQGLVVVDNSGLVTLLHFSVREYVLFRSTLNPDVDGLLMFNKSQHQVVSFCLRYLGQPQRENEASVVDKGSVRELTEFFPLLQYTTMWLGLHCVSVDVISADAPTLSTQIEAFFEQIGPVRMMLLISLSNSDTYHLSNTLQQISQWRSRVRSKETSATVISHGLAPWENRMAKHLGSIWLRTAQPYAATWGAFLQAESLAQVWGNFSSTCYSESDIRGISRWATGPENHLIPMNKYNLGHVFWYWHYTDAAIQCYEEASSLGSQNIEIALDIAFCVEQSKGEAAAQPYYKMAFGDDSPDQLKLSASRRRIWLRRRAYRAPTVLSPQAFSQQIKAYEERLSHDPHAYGAHADLGKLHFQSKDYASAIKVYQRAIDMFPSKAWIYTNMGSCYKMLAQTEDAEKWYRKAISMATENLEANPSLPNSYTLLGHAFFGSQDFEQAIRAWEKALALQNPKCATDGSLSPKHVGIYCDGLPCQHQSNEKTISGLRFICKECANFDICYDCWKEKSNLHDPDHTFLMIPSQDSEFFKPFLSNYFSIKWKLLEYFSAEGGDYEYNRRLKTRNCTTETIIR